jgi:hypothetical protein
VQVQPVNDVPLLNTAYPGQAALAAFPAGPYNVPVGESLVFNAANTRQIIVGDVDARESIAGQPPQQAMDNGILRTRLSASGLGTLTLAQTTGLTFINPGAANDGTGDQNMLFYGTITNINAALNGMRFTPNANDFATGSVQINVAVDDINPVTDPTTPDGTWRTGHRFGVAVDPITNPSLTGPSGAQDPVTRSITVNVTPPAGDFWGRWPRIGTSTL